MKFTVGMLDASTVFVKDGGKIATPKTSKNNNQQDKNEETTQPQHAIPSMNTKHYGQDLAVAGMNEVSPSAGYSTESAGVYEAEFETSTLAQHIRPSWSDFGENLNFNAGDIQDWNLDQLYNFENVDEIDPLLANRRFIQEYDERGNNFAGF